MDMKVDYVRWCALWGWWDRLIMSVDEDIEAGSRMWYQKGHNFQPSIAFFHTNCALAYIYEHLWTQTYYLIHTKEHMHVYNAQTYSNRQTHKGNHTQKHRKEHS